MDAPFAIGMRSGNQVDLVAPSSLFFMLQVQQQRFLSAAEHGGGGCQLSSKFSDSNVVAQPLSSAPEVHQHMFYAQMELWTSDALESTFPQHSRSIF